MEAAKDQNLILNRIIPAILALGTIANLILAILDFISKFKIGWLPSLFIIYNLSFISLIILWIFFFYRKRRRLLIIRDANILFISFIIIFYSICFILNSSYRIRDSSVEISAQIISADELIKRNELKEAVGLLL